MLEGRSVEQKRELVDVFTKEMSRICKVDPSAIHIIIHDLPKHNLAKAGKLVSDK